MSVTITLVLNFKPGAAAQFCAGVPDMLKDTKKMAGFRNIRVLKHKTDPNQVIFIEEWESEDAYNAYLAWRAKDGGANALAEALTSPPKMEVWPVLVAN